MANNRHTRTAKFVNRVANKRANQLFCTMCVSKVRAIESQQFFVIPTQCCIAYNSLAVPYRVGTTLLQLHQMPFEGTLSLMISHVHVTQEPCQSVQRGLR